MNETPLRSIDNRGTWMPILVPTYSTKIFIGQNRITTYGVPFIIGMLLARDSIVGIIIPSSISLPASLFTRFVMHHPATNSLVTLLARLHMMCIIEWAQRYLSDTRSDKSQSRSMPTQQTPSEIPVEHLYNHPVMLWCLVAHKVFLGIRELHNLIVIGTCLSHEESNSNILNDQVLS